ncbi:MAG: hypothetical protein K2J74_05645, partial [Muribaculaceae bacterium]|nr:hypothetical protein [Muribaculaceae bacterium]
MKRTTIITAIFLFISLAAQGINEYKDTDKAYNDYVELLKRHDVYITLPQNYAPINIRGVSDVQKSMGRGVSHMDCRPIDIEAIVEDDSCRVAICYPRIVFKFGSGRDPLILSSVHGGMKVEADLRMIHGDMFLDVRPLVNIIAEEDMSQYANADTAAIYEFELPNSFLGQYSKGVGIYLRKKNHPGLLLRLMFTRDSYKDKDKYIREALDNIRFGENPSRTFVELEKQDSGRNDFNFPTK